MKKNNRTLEGDMQTLFDRAKALFGPEDPKKKYTYNCEVKGDNLIYVRIEENEDGSKQLAFIDSSQLFPI